MASLFGWPFLFVTASFELKAEDCRPIAIANRRLTADWDTNYELRTKMRPVRIVVGPHFAVGPRFAVGSPIRS
jgi:hypothetical protein